jgi:hypothetical protein
MITAVAGAPTSGSTISDDPVGPGLEAGVLRRMTRLGRPPIM